MSDLARLHLENLTAFESLDLDFSPGVNVLLGANGTGKTHLLKVLYAACAITTGEDRDKSFGVKLRNVFAPLDGRVGRLARRRPTSVGARIRVARRNGSELAAEFSNHTDAPERMTLAGEIDWKAIPLESAYIPVKEMLAHAPGFLATLSRRELAFEEIYPDIIKRAYLPKLMGPVGPDRRRLLETLRKTIAGHVVVRGEHFFLRDRRGNLEFALLAEGLRKLAMIWLLIQNGTLLSGSVLFWDEPEANLNPSLLGQVVRVLLELQRMGVQVFLSTHNYVLLKEFDLQKEDADSIRYISLYRNGSDSVSAETADSYSSIAPNAIAETFDGLYDREVRRSLGGIGRARA
jgi:hypothetical protein